MLPVVSLIFGILSLIQCIPVIGGVVAIVTGVIGRKKARHSGQSTSMATAGILLGILGIVVSVIAFIVLLASGFAVFGALSGQAKVADQLRPAVIAAEAYGASTGTYNGVSLETLEKFGYIPANDMTVSAVPVNGGDSFCIQGATTADPGNVIHVPPTDGSTTLSYTIDGRTYRYATGPCPTG